VQKIAFKVSERNDLNEHYKTFKLKRAEQAEKKRSLDLQNLRQEDKDI